MATYDEPGVLPESLTVAFPKAVAGTITSQEYTLVTPLPTPGGAGVTRLVRSMVPALFDSELDTDPTNLSELTALAEQLASDWSDLQLGEDNEVYAGCVPWVLSALEDAVIWDWQDGKTYIRRPPWNEPELPPLFTGGSPETFPPCAGCGLTTNAEGCLELDYAEVAGTGLRVVADDPCDHLAVDYGCNLKLYGNQVGVDVDALAGTGLIGEGVTCKQLKVRYGCGLIISGGQLVVDNTVLAGPGLAPYGDCGLTATGTTVTPGCGLQVVGGVWSVNRADLIGPGLIAYSSGCAMAVYNGCGLTYDGFGRLTVSSSGISDGTTIVPLPDDPCAITVNYGCGLKYDGGDPLSGFTNKLIVDRDALAGKGLKAGTPGSRCQLALDTGCGFDYSGNTLIFKPSDVAGDCLDYDDTGGNCKLGVNFGCGLKQDTGKLVIDTDIAHTVSITPITDVSFSLDGGCLKVSVTKKQYDFNFNSCGVCLGVGNTLLTNPTTTTCLCVSGGSVS